jgi:hypothetical protein
VLNSAKAVIESAMFFAAETRLRVIAVDYTLAPHSKWRETPDEAIGVFRAAFRRFPWRPFVVRDVRGLRALQVRAGEAES